MKQLKSQNSFVQHWLFSEKYISKNNRWLLDYSQYKDVENSLNTFLKENKAKIFYLHFNEYSSFINDILIRQLFVLLHYGYGVIDMRVKFFEQYLYFIKEGDSWTLTKTKPTKTISEQINEFISQNKISKFRPYMSESSVLSPDGQELILHLIVCLCYLEGNDVPDTQRK